MGLGAWGLGPVSRAFGGSGCGEVGGESLYGGQWRHRNKKQDLFCTQCFKQESKRGKASVTWKCAQCGVEGGTKDFRLNSRGEVWNNRMHTLNVTGEPVLQHCKKQSCRQAATLTTSDAAALPTPTKRQRKL